MKLYITDDGAAIDLEHVLAVGEVFEDYSYIEPHMYILTLSFGSTKIIGYNTPEEVTQCREKLIAAWQSK